MADNMTPNTTLALLKATQVDSDKSVNALKNAKDLKKIEESAKEFEAVFLSEMVKPMFEGLETEGMFGGGKGEEVFRGLLIQEYGKMLSETGRIGIADSVKEELIRIQAAAKEGKTSES
ncbi:MAG TPA: flagellar biosynthesis protein FlgJ [Rhodospirillaceae bacterium]|nr:flagellar biosynthesis protein FlgJ [Rhodospirillaceae bacterium]